MTNDYCMPQGTAHLAVASLASRFTLFAIERFPFAGRLAADVFASLAAGADERNEASMESLRRRLGDELRRRASELMPPAGGDTTPGVAAADRWSAAVHELVDACDGFLRRAALRA